MRLEKDRDVISTMETETPNSTVRDYVDYGHPTTQGDSKGLSSVEISSNGKIAVSSKVALENTVLQHALHNVIELRIWQSLQRASKGTSPLSLIVAMAIAIVGVGLCLSMVVCRRWSEQLIQQFFAGRAAVTFSLTVRNVDYNLLSASTTLLRQFKTALRNAIVEQVGAELSTEHLQITLSAGSVDEVDVYVVAKPPHDVPAVSLQSRLLSESMVTTVIRHVKNVSRIDEVKTGDIDSSCISFPNAAHATHLREVAASRRSQRRNPRIESSVNEEHRVGDRVLTLDGKELDGIVRYVGNTEFADGTWIGIELPEPCGKNDGSINGKRYFECAPNHGVFVRKQLVKTTRGWKRVKSVVNTISAFRAAARNK